MKVYVLVSENKDGDQSFEMPITFGRGMRAYDSKSRALVYARRFNCKVVELETDEGKVVS